MEIKISEKDFLEQVIDLAHVFGWKVAHFRPAKTEHGWRTAIQADGKGFPDLVMVHAEKKRLIFAELKSEIGKPSPEQGEWLEDLRECQKTSVDKPLPVEKGVNIKDFLKGCKFIQIPEVYLLYSSDFDIIIKVLDKGATNEEVQSLRANQIKK